MHVSVLVKCPHDVRAEIVDNQPAMPGSGDHNFMVERFTVVFDCPICAGYHDGYRAAIQERQEQVKIPGSNTPGTRPVKDNPQA